MIWKFIFEKELKIVELFLLDLFCISLTLDQDLSQSSLTEAWQN